MTITGITKDINKLNETLILVVFIRLFLNKLFVIKLEVKVKNTLKFAIVDRKITFKK